jgi:GNAT superfamily N-acetyltransferase
VARTGQTKRQPPARLTRPAPLKLAHNVDTFDCGRDVISVWLKKQAKKASLTDTARTFVVCRGRRVVGFYSLAAGGVDRSGASGRLARNSPDPIPVFILARLGVHSEEQGNGLGQSLVADAMKRSLLGARHIAARALLVHALDAEAARFYKQHGFAPLSEIAETTLYITLKEIRDALS